MVDIDKKRMVYAFYLNENSLENPINKIHFSFLEKYINKFDEVIFGIIIDEGLNPCYIQELEEKILSFYHKNITFHLYENSQYREAIVFYNEVATKLELLDGITFYAHNKHTSDISTEELVMWVCGLYYFNLELPLDYHFTGVCFFGSPLLTDVKFNIPAVGNKYRWYYAGNFYWVKCQEVYRFMVNNNLKLPPLTNRYYSEMFPGELCDYKGFASTPLGTYVYGNGWDIGFIYMNLYYGENQWIFDEFYEVYKEKLKMVQND